MERFRWARPMGIAVVAAMALYAIAISQSHPEAVGAAVEQIGGAGVFMGAMASLLAISARFGRWQMLLRRLGHALSTRTSLLIYGAGIALTWTPGKLGETIRSAFLQPHGVPVPDSLAAFIADRLSDVIGVALLGLIAAGLAGSRTDLFVGIVLVGLAASLVAAQAITRGRMGAQWRLTVPLHRWAVLWTPRRVLAWIGLAGLAYGVQALVFAAFARAVAPGVGWEACVAAFAGAIFVGAASMAPAGLGAMEATLAYALTTMGLTWSDAIAVTVLTRLCTLWIPSGLGVVALLGQMRSAGQAEPVAIT